MKRFLIILCITAVIAFITTGELLSQNISPAKLTSKEIAKQIDIVKKEPCSNIENKLYLINNTYLLWQRKGSCNDNSYAYILLGSGLKELCSDRETIAGPKTKYTDGLKELFLKIRNGNKENNLGLDSTYTVKMIFSGK